MPNSPSEEVERLIATLRAPAQRERPPPIRVDNARGCVIILGGKPSIVVKQGERKQ